MNPRTAAAQVMRTLRARLPGFAKSDRVAGMTRRHADALQFIGVRPRTERGELVALTVAFEVSCVLLHPDVETDPHRPFCEGHFASDWSEHVGNFLPEPDPRMIYFERYGGPERAVELILETTERVAVPKMNRMSDARALLESWANGEFVRMGPAVAFERAIRLAAILRDVPLAERLYQAMHKRYGNDPVGHKLYVMLDKAMRV